MAAGGPRSSGILALTARYQELPVPEEILPWVVVTAFVAGGLMIFAALKMRRLEAYGVAVTTSILAMIISPGSVVGFPIGIWALVVLSGKEVRAAFVEKRKHG